MKQEDFTVSAAQEQPQEQLADNEIRLSDGRLIVMRETNGADEAAVAQMLGDKISMLGAGSAILVQANALKAIESIDGQKPPIMRSYTDYIGFARQFKTRDLNRIQRKYAEMNLEADANNPLA